MKAARRESAVWMSLMGFDRDQPDKGVSDFLYRVGEPPSLVSLLLYHPDIVHLHRGMEDEVTLPPDNCSFKGSPNNEDRTRQSWTNHDLRTLCTHLKARGVEPYLGIMGAYLGDRYHCEWQSGHPELCSYGRGGARGGLNVLKRFADSRYYEDFFTDLIPAVLGDYGFSGLHGADGICPPAHSLWQGDFSADMTDQFLAHSGCKLPKKLMARLGSDAPADLSARGGWIWANRRQELIAFYRWRWEGFFTKLCGRLHAAGRKVIVMSAGCSEPFEAIYRYGIDYRALFRAGVDFMVPETAPAGRQWAGWTPGSPDGSPLRYDRVMTLALFMSACMPWGKLLCLNGVKDATEGWDALRHLSPLLEKDIYNLGSLYRVTSRGVGRCADGLMVCLGDGLSREDWQWLHTRAAIGFGDIPDHARAPTLVWSDDSVDALLADYGASRRWSTHKIVYELFGYGAPTGFVVRSEDLDFVDGPLFVPNADLFGPEELQKLAAYDRGPVVTVAREDFNLSGQTPDITFTDPQGGFVLRAAAYRLPGADGSAITADLNAGGGAPDLEGDPALAADPGCPSQDLPFRRVSGGFLRACAALMGAAAPGELSGPPWAPLRVFAYDGGPVRVLVANPDRLHYVQPVIRASRPIQRVTTISPYPVLPPDYVDEGGTHRGFIAKVPPGGLSIFDIQWDAPGSNPEGGGDPNG